MKIHETMFTIMSVSMTQNDSCDVAIIKLQFSKLKLPVKVQANLSAPQAA